MTRHPRQALWMLVGSIAIAISLLPGRASAGEPLLVVHLVDGQRDNYPVSRVSRVLAESDSVLILGANMFAGYAMQSIQRIDFSWLPSGLDEPGGQSELRTALLLLQNQPNPFSSRTRIEYRLPRAGRVEVRIFTPNGRLIRTLVEAKRPAGSHEVVWDGCDAKGRRVPGGVYFYSMSAPGFHQGKQMIVLP